ncbi:MAG: low affinity iron permease family protein [Candidatus Binataceae bacterium]|nr:low affinity iron permease family protein [Candidatus Binataceae bacterium]
MRLNPDRETAAGITETQQTKELFRRFAQRGAEWTGSASGFIIASILMVVWAATGPYFRYSDTWQLVVNTGTDVITFLMVFLIQYTQNRDTREIHLKLDELLRSNTRARNEFMSLEHMSDEELDRLGLELAQRHAHKREGGGN